MHRIDILRVEWMDLLLGLAIATENVNYGFNILVENYNQPDRFYHNLNHIYGMLSTVHRFSKDDINNLAALKLAVWFHDFIYDTHRSDNEEKSAEFTGNLFRSWGIDPPLIMEVEKLILSTKIGANINPTLDFMILHDSDLEILGTDELTYQEYSRSIRQEYGWVSDVEYQRGRTKVLHTFLQRERIYHTDTMFNEQEAIARHNLTQEILTLN
jgi:predicted metal-dependent HD superfamily phosphohydrolase